MANQVSLKKLTEIIEPVVSSLGFELVDLDFLKENTEWFLKIYIDAEGGVLIEHCEKVSRAVSDLLDEKDPIEQSYILEVSSPGINRTLKREKDFEKFAGHDVEVKLYKPLNGKKIYEGKLVSLIDNVITIQVEDEKLEFNREIVAIIRLAVKF